MIQLVPLNRRPDLDDRLTRKPITVTPESIGDVLTVLQRDHNVWVVRIVINGVYVLRLHRNRSGFSKESFAVDVPPPNTIVTEID